jgi:selenocysteine-specific elongation factor
MMLFPGDRVVLRRPAPVNTFAGGLVLDTRLGRYRRIHAAGLETRPTVQRSAWPQLFQRWIDEAGTTALSLDDLAGRLGVLPDSAESVVGRLLEKKTVIALPTQPPRFVIQRAVDELAQRAGEEIAARLKSEAVSAGVPARDFMASVLPVSALDLASHYLEVLRLRKAVEVTDGRVLPPGASSHMTADGAELSQKLDDLYRDAGIDPPSPAEAAERLSKRPAMVEGVCRFLVQQGVLVRLEGRWIIHRSVLDNIVRDVTAWDLAEFAVGEFKQKFDLTRKLAIPILEWLDSERITVRVGNKRKVLNRRR